MEGETENPKQRSAVAYWTPGQAKQSIESIFYANMSEMQSTWERAGLDIWLSETDTGVSSAAP